MSEVMTQWETADGVKFLKKIGLESGQTVLDFGCRVGHYSIPAALIVGNSGVVYAMDKEQYALNELEEKAKANNLKNITIIKTDGQAGLDFKTESIDVVLFYDVLHYLEKHDREKLYRQARRALKQDGLLSVYPKHTHDDYPNQMFKSLNVSDVKTEIEDSEFYFEGKLCGIISHDDALNTGCTLNFRKNEHEANK